MKTLSKMYFRRYSLFILSITVSLLFVAGCKREFSPIPYKSSDELSIMQYLRSRPDLSIFTKIIEYTGTESNLSTAGAYTLFVPDDQAFTEFLNANSIGNIEEKDPQYWLDFVQYHLVDGKINVFSMINGALSEPTFFRDKFLVSDISVSYESVIINRTAKIIEVNREQTNGFVQVIDKVLNPPIKTIYEALKETGDFSVMLDIFQETKLDSLLKESDKITVLVEPDSVLNRISFNKSMIPNLENWAKYHISEADNYSVEQLSADRRFPLFGVQWAVFKDGDNWLFSGDSVLFYNVDNIALNGIYHVVSDTLSLFSKDIPVSIVFPFYYPGSPFLEPNVFTLAPAQIKKNNDSNSKYHTERARAEGVIKENEHWGPIFGFDAQNVGDYFEFTIPDVPAGTYKLEILNASISTARANFVPVYKGKIIGPVTNFGSTANRYQYGSTWVRWQTLTPVGTVEVNSRGPVTIRMIVYKLNNTPSYSWDLIADQAVLTPIM